MEYNYCRFFVDDDSLFIFSVLTQFSIFFQLLPYSLRDSVHIMYKYCVSVCVSIHASAYIPVRLYTYTHNPTTERRPTCVRSAPRTTISRSRNRFVDGLDPPVAELDCSLPQSRTIKILMQFFSPNRHVPRWQAVVGDERIPVMTGEGENTEDDRSPGFRKRKATI